jgi:hypothetical protein
MAKHGLWPTPQAHKTTESGEIVNADGTPWDGVSKPHSASTGRPITTALADAVRMWPTPIAHAGSNRRKKPTPAQAAGKAGMQLAAAVNMCFPTPPAQDAKNNGAPSQMVRNTKPLNAEIGGSLNPTWVEWLMNWPTGWTDMEALSEREIKYWQAASATHDSGCFLREMWFNIEAGAPPQGWQPDEQRSAECAGSMFAMPPRAAQAPDDDGMCDLRDDVPTEAGSESCPVREFELQQGARQAISRVAVGISNRVDRLRCIGNGQVPAVAALAWRVLNGWPAGRPGRDWLSG